MHLQALWELAERIGEVKNRGMDENEMKTLKTRKFTAPKKVFTEDHEGPQCRVCLSAYKSGDNLCTLPCKHEFHAACVKEWLKVGKISYMGFLSICSLKIGYLCVKFPKMLSGIKS